MRVPRGAEVFSGGVGDIDTAVGGSEEGNLTVTARVIPDPDPVPDPDPDFLLPSFLLSRGRQAIGIGIGNGIGIGKDGRGLPVRP
jgi:hypothetical protein